MYKCSWKDRYLLSLSEEMNATDIMKLRGVNKKEALKIRKEALAYCKQKSIKVVGQKVPTEAVLEVTGKRIDFYYNRMQLESRAKEN